MIHDLNASEFKFLSGFTAAQMEDTFQLKFTVGKDGIVMNDKTGKLQWITLKACRQYFPSIDFDFKITEIREQTLKRQASRKRILHDYIEEKLAKAKEGSTISLPVYLRRMLSKEDADFIKGYWKDNNWHMIDKLKITIK